VSANPSVPTEESNVENSFRFSKKKSGPARVEGGGVASLPDGKFVGITGVFLVAAFLALSVYLVVKYLL
jgi:hypothetical protein